MSDNLKKVDEEALDDVAGGLTSEDAMHIAKKDAGQQTRAAFAMPTTYEGEPAHYVRFVSDDGRYKHEYYISDATYKIVYHTCVPTT